VTVAATEPKPVLRLVLSLLLVAIIGIAIWVIYGFASGSFAILGNCGPEGFIGRDGYWVGGSASSEWAAAVIGGVLGAGAGAAVWRLRQTAVVVVGFIVVYIATLIILALGLSRVIWGPRHCVMY
jgi:hypothetical protein